MTQSSKILSAAALTSLGLIVAASALGSFNSGARAVEAPATAAERIATIFDNLPAEAADPALLRAARQSRKGDLLAGAGCAQQSWPEIAQGCLVSAGEGTAHTVRFVTIGYQDGPASSVMVRMPAPQIASR